MYVLFTAPLPTTTTSGLSTSLGQHHFMHRRWLNSRNSRRHAQQGRAIEPRHSHSHLSASMATSSTHLRFECCNIKIPRADALLVLLLQAARGSGRSKQCLTTNLCQLIASELWKPATKPPARQSPRKSWHDKARTQTQHTAAPCMCTCLPATEQNSCHYLQRWWRQRKSLAGSPSRGRPVMASHAAAGSTPGTTHRALAAAKQAQ
jgi:hypothetical protein